METRDPINSGLANPPTPSHPTPLNSPLRIFLPALAVLVRTRALALAPPSSWPLPFLPAISRRLDSLKYPRLDLSLSFDLSTI